MTFIPRQINVTFTLGTGSFGEGAGQTVKLKGLRVSSRITKAGGNSMGMAQIQIYGMTLSMMNQLSTLGIAITLQRRNTVLLEAGDDEIGMSAVFVGTIKNAWGDFQSAPEVPFHVEAYTGLYEGVKPVPPSSYNGSTSVVSIMQSLATLMGKSFENSGVSSSLSSPYFSGSARDQALACVQHAGIEWNGLDNNVLAIWPAGQARNGQSVVVSPATGMDSYPTFTSKGVIVKTLFNPSIGYGSKITVKSDLTPACGDWVVYKLDYALDANYPRGDWFSIIEAARPGQAVVA